ncbi:hypothetical protein QFC19_009126 [Naganishia cerealis]|uniref:Uncharacterized protein n=1 Tax=Naganishia cerealis TaxID=610337 RepID=A0ACC2UXE2_9TREE|nr:hypothetical protein QFC19_009126 [Naganishia cerealis]
MPADDPNETMFWTSSEFSEHPSEYEKSVEPDNVLFQYRDSRSVSLQDAHIGMMAHSSIFLKDSDESLNRDSTESYATWLVQNDIVTSNSMQTDQSSRFHPLNRVFESSLTVVNEREYQKLEQQKQGKYCTLGVRLHLRSDFSINSQRPKQVFSFEILFTYQGRTGEENDVFDNLVVGSLALEHWHFRDYQSADDG